MKRVLHSFHITHIEKDYYGSLPYSGVPPRRGEVYAERDTVWANVQGIKCTKTALLQEMIFMRHEIHRHPSLHYTPANPRA